MTTRTPTTEPTARSNIVTIAILSDIHANGPALDAVLSEIDGRGITRIWVCGDIVGYGPDPSYVTKLVRERAEIVVAGNHDVTVATAQGYELFNEVGSAAVDLHRRMLTVTEKNYLGNLPIVGVSDDVTIVHGSLRNPVWEYVFTGEVAAENLAQARTVVTCNGHTHLPAIFTLDGGEGSVTIGSSPVMLNPGSVGQPRDGDSRASWATLDPITGVAEFMRTAYNITETQQRIKDLRLPLWLAERLVTGE